MGSSLVCGARRFETRTQTSNSICDRERSRSLSQKTIDESAKTLDKEASAMITNEIVDRTAVRPSTRTLLACATVAAPLWAVVSLAQAATRDGFDLTRHPLSALSNGDLGWLQIANFILAGVLTVAGASGLARVLFATPGGVWAPRLVRVSGFGLIAAGVFVMDPADGYPAGTPAGMPATFSWHSIG